MRIVQINSVFNKGSTGSIVGSIHNYLLLNNIDSYVIYGRGKRIKQNNTYKFSFEFLSKINAIRSKLTGYVYAGNLISTKRIIRKLKKNKPDVVHLHNLNDHFVNEYKLLNFLSKNNIKTIITLHSEQMFTGSCGYSLDCTQWKTSGCTTCPHLKLSTTSKIDKTNKAFNKLNKIYKKFNIKNLIFVACTPWLESKAKQSLLIKHFYCKTILNGADDKIFTNTNCNLRKIYNIPKDNNVILFVCPRMQDPIKGHQFISEISTKLDANETLIIVGKVTTEIIKRRNVIYTGEIIDKSKLSKLYNTASVTIMLSQRECFPMVICESLLCGTPVSLFKCGGPDNAFSKDFVKFSDYGNIDDLLKSARLLYKVNKKDCEEYAHNKYSNTIMSKKYLSIYNDLFNNRIP